MGRFFTKFRIIISSIICLLMLIQGGTVYAAEASDYIGKQSTIRVGYFGYNGYHDMAPDGSYSGYGYEQLSMMGNYMDDKFEYIGYFKPIEEHFDMLRNGEIDMMPYVFYTDERASEFMYSNVPIGACESIITTLKYNNNIMAQDYSTYNGKTVGAPAGCIQIEQFKEFAEKNNITYKLELFPTMERTENALKQGKIDMMLSTSVRNLKFEKILDSLGKNEFYIITKKSNYSLMSKINKALAKLDEAEPDWRINLENKYFNISDEGANLTDEEYEYLDYLRENKIVLKVLACPDRYPYSYLTEDNQIKGVVPTLFDNIAENLGIEYEYCEAYTRTQYNEMLDKRVADIVLDYTGEFADAEVSGYKITENYIQTGYTEVRRKNDNSAIRSLAIVIDSNSTNGIIEKHYTDAHCLYYESLEKCLNAVLEKNADATILFNYTTQQLMSSDSSYKYDFAFIPNLYINFKFGIKSEDGHYLRSVINKLLIKYRYDGTLANIIEAETQQQAVSHSFAYYIANNPILATALFVVVVVLISLSILTVYFRIKNKGLKHSLELKRDIEALHEDERQHMAVIRSLSNINYAIYLIDIVDNKFKEIQANDTLHLALGNQGEADKAMQLLTNYLVANEYKDGMQNFSDLGTLADRIGDKQSISYEFVEASAGWTRGTIIASDRDINGRVIQVLFVFKQINDEKNKEFNLEDISRTDVLTDFKNRRAFYRDIAHMEEEQKDEKSLGIIFADVNGLKVVNDTKGHDAGDKLILDAATGMKKAFPDSNYYRIGGDEFVIFCSDISEDLFNRRVANIANYLEEDVSISIGSVWIPEAKDIEANVAKADKLMYQNKNEYYKNKYHDRRRKSENKDVSELLELAENIPGGFVMYKAEGDGELISFNKELIHTFGCVSADELRNYANNTFRGMVHDDDWEQVSAMLDDDSDEIKNIDLLIVCKNEIVKNANVYCRLVQTKQYGAVCYAMIVSAM